MAYIEGPVDLEAPHETNENPNSRQLVVARSPDNQVALRSPNDGSPIVRSPDNRSPVHSFSSHSSPGSGSPEHRFTDHSPSPRETPFVAPPPQPNANNQQGGSVSAYDTPEHVDAPAPTKVDAYKPRGIRSSKLNALSSANVALRAFTAVFSLICFSLVASNKDSFTVASSGFFDPTTFTLNFDDLFYLSYLLTATVISFTYAIVTMAIFMYFMTTGKALTSRPLIVGVFALDQIISYLLMSASSSAATGIRAQRSVITVAALNNFESQAYAGVAMGFVAFFLLALASLISGHRLLTRNRL